MAQQIGAKTVAPSHYQCFVKRNFDAQEWATTFPVEKPELLIVPYNRYVVYHK